MSSLSSSLRCSQTRCMDNDVRATLKIAGMDATILELSDPFQVSCGVDGCASNCCTASAPIILNPYEIARVCSGARMSYEDLLDIVDTDRAKGFPLVMLPRNPSCHFWTATGCRIYRARPLACRLYPLGRVFDTGRSCLVRPDMNVCSGAVPSRERTVSDYLKMQDVDGYVRMADAWIEFVSEIERLPLQDSPVTSVAFHLLVYSPDTPPAQGAIDPALSLEDRFLLRLATARGSLPRFLKLS